MNKGHMLQVIVTIIAGTLQWFGESDPRFKLVFALLVIITAYFASGWYNKLQYYRNCAKANVKPDKDM